MRGRVRREKREKTERGEGKEDRHGEEETEGGGGMKRGRTWREGGRGYANAETGRAGGVGEDRDTAAAVGCCSVKGLIFTLEEMKPFDIKREWVEGCCADVYVDVAMFRHTPFLS